MDDIYLKDKNTLRMKLLGRFNTRKWNTKMLQKTMN